MKKVYILQDGGHDYSAAESFGELVFCTDHAINKWNISAMYEVLMDALEDAHEDDLILISSLATFCCVATAIMTERFGQVHYLIYKDNAYTQRDLYLSTGL